MGETVSFKDVKRELSKRKVKQKIKGFFSWCCDHPAEVVAIVTGIGIITTKAAKIHTVNVETRRRATDFYDNRLGIHAIARRPLKPDELEELIRRYTENKESYATILMDMGLYKG